MQNKLFRAKYVILSKSKSIQKYFDIIFLKKNAVDKIWR